MSNKAQNKAQEVTPKHESIQLTNISSAILSFGSIQDIIKFSKKINKEKSFRGIIIDVLDKINDYSSTCKHGVMFNALVEKREKKILYSFKKELPDLMVQADSGGLQVLTAGLSDDPKVKDDVYEVQADYCDYAMSFDKMPILLSEDADKGIKLNHSVKFFIAGNLYDAGRESGENVKKQIETFMKKKSKAKVLTILQGWEVKDYNEYARGLFSVFNEMSEGERTEYYKYIGGVSLGTTAVISYFNMLDVFCRAPMDLTNVPVQFRNMFHILALGGISKSGILFLLNKNFFSKEVHYTFDSTSNVSAATFGKYTQETDGIFRTNSVGYDHSDVSAKFIEELYNEFNDIIEKHLHEINTLEEFRDKYTIWNDEKAFTIKEIADKYPHLSEEEQVQRYVGVKSLYRFLHFALEYKKYIMMTNKIQEHNFSVISDSTLKIIYKKLSTIDTYEEYMEQREFFKLMLLGKKESTMTYCKDEDEFHKLQNLKSSLDEEW